jgi:hypothetical protein
MPSARKITARDKPEVLAKTASQNTQHLAVALAIAQRRASRSKPLVRELLANAIAEGLATGINGKMSAVSFKVPHLKQTWHQLIPWQYFKTSTPSETATLIASGLRESIRRNESKSTERSKSEPNCTGVRKLRDA